MSMSRKGELSDDAPMASALRKALSVTGTIERRWRTGNRVNAVLGKHRVARRPRFLVRGKRPNQPPLDNAVRCPGVRTKGTPSECQSFRLNPRANLSENLALFNSSNLRMADSCPDQSVGHR